MTTPTPRTVGDLMSRFPIKTSLRRGMVATDGPGWAVTDWEGAPLEGRWPTEEEAREDGLLGVYLLSGYDVTEIKDTPETNMAATESVRDLIDTDSGRIDNWTVTP